MSVDGIFLSHLKIELENIIKNSKIYKVYQPSRYELSLLLRKENKNYNLIISANADSPRVNLTSTTIKNPETPPDFCMLMRKKLISSEIVGIQQEYLERVLHFNIKSKDEIGCDALYTLAVEIMGKYSNIILVNGQGKIVDAIKRVTPKMSSKRLILPGIEYRSPPSQNKLCILNIGRDKIVKEILGSNKDKLLSSSIIDTLQGISYIIYIWIIKSMKCDVSIKMGDLTVINKEELRRCIIDLIDITKNIKGKPFLVHLSDNSIDISFVPINGCKCEEYKSFSELIEYYYYKKIINERVNSKVGSLIKLIRNVISSKNKKITIQEKELEQYKENENYKLLGDILISNMYKIKRGMNNIELVNFLSDNGEILNIQLDSSMDGYENVNRYYKLYKKAKIANAMLKEQIEIAKNDIIYLESVLDVVERSNTEIEIKEIYNELYDQGYVKDIRKLRSKGKNRVKTINLMEFKSPGGFKVIIGKSAIQNDRLTYKIARKNDIWFHVKDFPGSHTVLVTNGKEPPYDDILFAAKLCAFHSKARNSSNVAVDYTKILNVNRPKNYRPGMAVYCKYNTIYTNPENIDIKH